MYAQSAHGFNHPPSPFIPLLHGEEWYDSKYNKCGARAHSRYCQPSDDFRAKFVGSGFGRRYFNPAATARESTFENPSRSDMTKDTSTIEPLQSEMGEDEIDEDAEDLGEHSGGIAKALLYQQDRANLGDSEA
jgi:hypothetical protein